MNLRKIANPLKSSLLFKRQKFNYFSLVDKPVYSLALGSISEASSQLLQLGYHELLLTPQFSCIIGGFLFRIAAHGFTSFFAVIYLLIQNMKNNNDSKSLLNKWIEKVFLVDWRRDCQFYVHQRVICRISHSRREKGKKNTILVVKLF